MSRTIKVIFPKYTLTFYSTGFIFNDDFLRKNKETPKLRFLNKMRKKEKKITIRDIARDCGVGLGTVSRVINSQPGVKDEIRRKISQYIEDIGWRCNTLSQRLKLSEPGKTVVFIASVSILERKYDQDLLRIVLEQTIAAGFYPLTLFGQCRENLERCADTKPYAVIVVGTSSFEKDAVRLLLESGTKVIGLGECDEFAGPIIFPDYRKAAAKATKMLIKTGHQHIGFFGGMGIIRKIESIEQIYIRRIREMISGIIDAGSGFDVCVDAVSDCFSDLSILKRKLRTNEHTAWICSDEKMCRQFLYTTDSLGIRVPDDLAMIGFTQDLPFYSFALDISRFYPNNKTQAAQVLELLQSPEAVIDDREINSNCLFHSGSTHK